MRISQDDLERIDSHEAAIKLVERIETEAEAYTSRIDPLDRARCVVDAFRSALIQVLTHYRKR